MLPLSPPPSRLLALPGSLGFSLYCTGEGCGRNAQQSKASRTREFRCCFTSLIVLADVVMVVSKQATDEFIEILKESGISVSSGEAKGHIVSLRARLSEIVRHNDNDGQRNASQSVLKPLHADIIEWVLGKGLDSQTRSEILWRLYGVATAGTKRRSEASTDHREPGQLERPHGHP